MTLSDILDGIEDRLPQTQQTDISDDQFPHQQTGTLRQSAIQSLPGLGKAIQGQSHPRQSGAMGQHLCGPAAALLRHEPLERCDITGLVRLRHDTHPA
jgi:hypothetical protein